MEYPEFGRSRSEIQDSASISSKSVDSFGSEATDSEDSFYRERRRESSVGPILEKSWLT